MSRRKSPSKSPRRRSCKYGTLKRPVKLPSGRKRYCKLSKSPKRSPKRAPKKSPKRVSKRSPKRVSKIRYTITQYTKNKAKKLGVTVKRSTNKKKKLDVFKSGKKIASVGAMGYKDYPTYWVTEGKQKADRRRKAYKNRHEKDRHNRGTNGWYADQLLW